MKLSHFLIIFAATNLVVISDEPECQAFHEIYSSGKDLCETMWGDAFIYSTNISLSYTMWYFESNNPNNQITINIGMNTTDECYLDYFHKEYVSSESINFTECHPWKSESCCHYETVKDVNTINNNYGQDYLWDRCGELSQSCERFFVQEACFYECDPNVGLYRRYWDLTDEDYNSWEIYQMPIQSYYCDAWYIACYNDLFCATDSGNFFSCAKAYQEANVNSDIEQENEELEEQVVTLIIVVSIVAVLCLALVGVIWFLRFREKKGKPIFLPLEANDTSIS